MKKLTHIADDSTAVMVDVSAKPNSKREAVAAGFVRMQPATLAAIAEDEIAKGNVFGVARIAGIQAAKLTWQLIPLCHPLALSHLEVNFESRVDGVAIVATARTTGPTGVEMEALTAVSVAALTIYDMCKAIDKAMVIGEVRLLSKTKTEVAG